MSKKIILILFLITIFAGVLRFYNLHKYPVSPYWDEVSIGYNSYSILKTGKDEYGNRLPVLFEAFEDYKMPGYIYASVIPIKIFGLNEFSVRFLSAFLGTLSVFILFFFAREVLLISNKIPNTKYDTLGLLTAGLLAIIPWHIQLSRTGFEANAGLFFVILGAYMLLFSARNNNAKIFLTSIIFWVLSIYFYRSFLIFTPIFLLASIFILKNFFSNKKVLALCLLFFVFLSVPIYKEVFLGEGAKRQNEVSVFSSNSKELEEAAIKRVEAGNSLYAKIVYNRRLVYSKTVVKNYISHFGSYFLFTGDGNPRHSAAGMLYIWQLPFMMIGGYFMFKNYRQAAKLVLLWTLLAPIPAALALPSPHALRALTLIPSAALLTGFGLYFVYSRLKKEIKVFFVFFVFILGGVFLISFLDQYRSVVLEKSRFWGDGYKQLIEEVSSIESDYDRVIVSGRYWQPHSYFLFYKKYDPAVFQNEGSKESFGKYIFGGTSWDRGVEFDDVDLREIAGEGNALAALSPREYENQKDNMREARKIYNHSGELMFYLGEVK